VETRQILDEYQGGQERFQQRLEEIRARMDAILKGAESQMPAAADIAQLDSLGGELERLFLDNLKQFTTFVEDMRKIVEEANRRAVIVEKRSSPRQSQAKIQELSEELTRELRLDRIDSAIKELLDFLADADFFAAHASTGRRRRLRTLQNALGKALEK
jgi:hypothetical protein